MNLQFKAGKAHIAFVRLQRETPLILSVCFLFLRMVSLPISANEIETLRSTLWLTEPLAVLGKVRLFHTETVW